MGDVCPELESTQRPICICGKPMQVRRSRRLETFWSCPRFPVCKHTKPINQGRFARYLEERDSRAVR